MTDILFLGAGAVGGPIAGWLSEAGHRVRVLARGATADAIETHGIVWNEARSPLVRHAQRVEVVRDLRATTRPELVVVGVKTRSLSSVLSELGEVFGDELLVAGLQNGIEVLRVLPANFRRSALALVHFNAWVDSPGVYGVQERGPLVVAPFSTTRADDVRFVADHLATATTVVRADSARDAALCKMVVNLTGSLQTLLALHERPADDPAALQWLLTTLVDEGVRTARAAGVREVRVPGTPPWVALGLAASLPRGLTRPFFERNLRKMRVSSLAQDVARGARDTELDAIHGELVRMAESLRVDAPVARTVLRLLESRLAERPFQPMHASEVAREVRRA